MDKTTVDTRTLEEQLVDTLMNGAYGATQDDRLGAFIESAVADFREKFEDECWEAWNIARAFEKDEKYNKFLDERRILREQQEAFRMCVSAYNREREKESKTEHKFTGLPDDDEESESGIDNASIEEHPDNCTHHDDDEI